MFKWNRQEGFNLVEVMIAGALVAGLGLAAANIFSKQTDANKYNRLLTELNAYHSNLRDVYSDVRNCNALLSNGSGSPITNIGQGINSLKVCCPAAASNPSCVITQGNDACLPAVNNNVSIATANMRALVNVNNNISLPSSSGTVVNPNIRLSSIRIFDLAEGEYVSAMTSSNPGTKYYELHLQYNLLNTKAGRTDIRKTIPVGVKFSSGSAARFQGCVSNASNTKDSFTREMCEALNGQTGNQNIVRWEKGEEGVERCVRLVTNTTHNCPSNQVFLGISSTGESYCGDINDYINHDDLINSANTGNCAAGSTIEFRKGYSGRVHVSCSAPPTTPALCGCTEWETWSLCSGGSQSRSRSCTSSCPPTTITTETQLCAVCLPVNGTWSYTPWTTCNPLTLKRTRSTIACTGASCGGNCGTPVTEQTCTCNWTPNTNPANLRSGHCVIQSNGCGGTRELWGTCNTMPSYTCMEHALGPGCHY